MICPFCFLLEPTWDHIQECGHRSREKQVRERRKEDRERQIKERERRRKDVRDGTWHGWRVMGPR